MQQQQQTSDIFQYSLILHVVIMVLSYEPMISLHIRSDAVECVTNACFINYMYLQDFPIHIHMGAETKFKIGAFR